MIRRRMPAAVAVAAGLAVAGSSLGSVVQVRFDSVTPGGAVDISSNGGSNFMRVMAGTYTWTRLGGDYAGPGAEGSFGTYCIEVSESVSTGHTYTYEIVSLADAPTNPGGMGAAKADLLAELFGRHHSDSLTRPQAMGFQLAVWEIVHDDGLDLSSGSFVASAESGAVSSALSFLSSLDGTGPRAALAAMIGNGQQDHVFMVPAPGALLMAGLGFGAMGVRRRRI